MAKQSQEPVAPQAQVTPVAAPNQTARVEAYTDTSKTKRAVDSSPAPTPEPAFSGAATTGDSRRYYAEDGEKEIENTATNPAADPPPQAPNSWKHGRDPYANNGMVGQDFFKNQGD